jgi:glutathione S-transferase
MQFMTQPLNFFHSPNMRSLGTLALLKELNADYTLRAINMKMNEQRGADYMAINPMGKVPALQHGDVLITEQAAIYMFLAELYPAAGLSPAVGDPLRGPYLRWMVFYGSSFEPAAIDRAMKHTPASTAMCGYGDFDTMLATVTAQLAKGPYLLGDTFSAADILWGTSLGWTMGYGLLPPLPEIKAYVDRIEARPSVQWARAHDAALAAEHAAQVEAAKPA